MNRMKPHLRRVPATDIRRGDLIYLASERGLCRVMNSFETHSLGDNSPMAVIDYVVIGFDGDKCTHCMSAWKVVGWNHRLEIGYVGEDSRFGFIKPSVFDVMAGIDDRALASLLNDVRNYPSKTADGVKFGFREDTGGVISIGDINT